MTTVQEILHRHLLKQITLEEKLTNFVNSWPSDYRFSSGISKTFPVATFELFLKLSGGRETITLNTLLQGGCKSNHLACKLYTLLHNEEATQYNTFAKRLALLPYKDLLCLFEAFYCEMFDASLRSLISIESPYGMMVTTKEATVVAQHETNTNTNTNTNTSNATRRYWWWQRYKCVCPFNRRRNTWY